MVARDGIGFGSARLTQSCANLLPRAKVRLNRRHGDFQYLASLYVSVTYGDASPNRHHV